MNQSVNDLLPIEQAIEIKGASRPCCLEEFISSRVQASFPYPCLLGGEEPWYGARVSQLARCNSTQSYLEVGSLGTHSPSNREKGVKKGKI